MSLKMTNFLSINHCQLLSLIFSLGTLIIGITKAGIYWKTVYNRDEEKEATNDDENKEASPDPIEMKEVSA